MASLEQARVIDSTAAADHYAKHFLLFPETSREFVAANSLEAYRSLNQGFTQALGSAGVEGAFRDWPFDEAEREEAEDHVLRQFGPNGELLYLIGGMTDIGTAHDFFHSDRGDILIPQFEAVVLEAYDHII